MKRSTLLFRLGSLSGIVAIVILSFDNLRLRHHNPDREQIVGALVSPDSMVQLTYTEVSLPGDQDPGTPRSVILDATEAQRVLDKLSQQSAKVVAFPPATVPSGLDATFEIADRKHRAKPTVGADGFTVDLVTSSTVGGEHSEPASHLLWTGQTAVIPSGGDSGHLLFVKAQIQSGQNMTADSTAYSRESP